MTHPASTPAPVALDLERLFGHTATFHDLGQGLVTDAADDRQLYVCEDIVRGIHAALHYEAGEAWALILEHCGRIWGERVFRRLGRAVQAQTRRPPEDLPLSDWLAWVEGWFARSGWGRLRFDLDDAVRHGIVRADLDRSLFVAVLDDQDERVDALVAGVLGAVFSNISGQDLGCVEAACARQGAPRCTFLVSARSRIEAITPRVENGDSLAAVIDALRDA